MNLQQRNLVSKTYKNGMTRYTLSGDYLPKYLNWNTQTTANDPTQLQDYLTRRTGLEVDNIQFDWDAVSFVIN